MKAYELAAAGRFELRELPVPPCGPGEVRIRVSHAGICGSDIHAYHGRHPFVPPPIVLGHEFSGTVDEIGPGASDEGLRPGERVTVLPSVSCGECRTCRQGRPNICERIEVIGCVKRQGAYAEYVTVPRERVFRLPDAVGMEEGAFVEPLSVGVHAVRRAGVKKGDRALVIGAGTIGLLLAEALGVEGASVLISDPKEDRLELARALVTDIKTVDPAKEDIAAALEKTWPSWGADFIFECVGLSATLSDAFKVGRKGNRIVVLGIFSQEVAIPVGTLQDWEMELIGSLMYTVEDYEKAIGLLAEGRVRVKELVDEVFPIGKIEEAFERAESPRAGKTKVLLRVEGWPSD